MANKKVCMFYPKPIEIINIEYDNKTYVAQFIWDNYGKYYFVGRIDTKKHFDLMAIRKNIYSEAYKFCSKKSYVNVKNICDINYGYSWFFAEKFLQFLLDEFNANANIVSTSSFSDELNEVMPHIWIHCEGFHFDADCMDGVSSWKDLTIFKDSPECSKVIENLPEYDDNLHNYSKINLENQPEVKIANSKDDIWLENVSIALVEHLKKNPKDRTQFESICLKYKKEIDDYDISLNKLKRFLYQLSLLQ
ncbi:MAG: hypothetical protein HC836_50440 [Richelia sp. RM2_1_2]|nr:hypothetical protein [Richelia sp. RM2_1_2]